MSARQNKKRSRTSSSSNLPVQPAYSSSGNYQAFGYGSMHDETHPSQLSAQQQPFFTSPQQQDLPRAILPPGKNDLEILENLKKMIKDGQHEMYRPLPQPTYLASLYLGPSQSQRPEYHDEDPGYTDYSKSRGSHHEPSNNALEQGLAENRAPAPAPDGEPGKRLPRAQLKNSWDRSMAFSDHHHQEQTQPPLEISTSSATSVSGPPSADLNPTDAQVSDSTQPVAQQADSEVVNGHQQSLDGSTVPAKAEAAHEYDAAGVPETHGPGVDQAKSDSVPSVDDRRRDVEHARPGPPSERSFHPRDDRYTDYRDYRDRRPPYDRFRDNRYAEVRRPPPEERHYEPSYDYPPRRYSDAEPAYHSRHSADPRPHEPKNESSLTMEEAASSLAAPVSEGHQANNGSHLSYPPDSHPAPPPTSQDMDTKPTETVHPSFIPAQPVTATQQIKQEFLTEDTIPVPQYILKPAETSQPSSSSHTPGFQLPPKDQSANATSITAQGSQPAASQPTQPSAAPAPNMNHPPSRQSTLDDRAVPAPAPARYNRPASPATGERATYPPHASKGAPANPRIFKGPHSPPRLPPGRNFKSRDPSRERPTEYRGGGSSYRPSYDHGRPDAMDIDSRPLPPRYNDDRSFRHYSPERSRPPPPPSASAGAPSSDPPYDDRYPSGPPRDYYPPPYGDRRRDYGSHDDDFYRPRGTWDRSAGGPPPPASAADRDRYDPRDPAPARPYAWDSREDRDRYPRPGSPVGRSYGRPVGSRPGGPYPGSSALPPSPTPPFARVRQRSMSPPRRTSIDDSRPPLKRTRDDDYTGDYYGGGPPPPPTTTTTRRPRDYRTSPPPPRTMSPPPLSGGSGYYDRAPPSSASTTGSGGPPPESRSYPPRDYPPSAYERPRSPPPPGRGGYVRPGGYGGRDERRYPPPPPSGSMLPPRRP